MGGQRFCAGLLAFAQKPACAVCAVSAQVEAEMAELSSEDAQAFRDDLGLKEPGLDRVIRTTYELLGLITYLTAGKQEVRAWTVRKGSTAPQAAGVIHTDFERGFIKAEVIWWEDWIKFGSEAKCREAGKQAIEGREYIVRDGDVMHFRFNV